MRLGELGTVYRYERSGTMHGLLRVRGFTQDDAHIFCTPEQIEDEVVSCLEFALDTLKTFGFEQYEAEISTWDGGKSGKYDGAPELWELAEGALQRAVDRLGIKAPVIPDEAAFYGPKIDVKLLDALGRKWQLSTVQFDFTLPQRFGLEYVAADGARHQPLMVHRALYGSIERFFGTLVEHYAGAFPVWLAPVQVVVMPITDRQLDYAKIVHARLEAAGLRSHLDDRKEKVNLKIREAQIAEGALHAGGRRPRSRSRHRVGAPPQARRHGREAAGAVCGRRVQAGRVEIRDGIIARSDPEPHHRLHRRGGVHAFADTRAQLHVRLHLLLRPHHAHPGRPEAGGLAALGAVHHFQEQRARTCCGVNCASSGAFTARPWSTPISPPKRANG